MRADGRFMEQFELYIRRSDQAMRLVEKGTRKPLAIEAYFPASRSDGVFVRPRGETGVFLFPDEVHTVDEFPQISREGKL